MIAAICAIQKPTIHLIRSTLVSAIFVSKRPSTLAKSSFVARVDFIVVFFIKILISLNLILQRQVQFPLPKELIG